MQPHPSLQVEKRGRTWCGEPGLTNKQVSIPRIQTSDVIIGEDWLTAGRTQDGNSS